MSKEKLYSTSIGLIIITLLFWLSAEILSSAVKADEPECTIIEETDTYIQKNCKDSRGNISASIESKPLEGITIIKSDKGTPQIKVEVEKFVDEQVQPTLPIIEVKDGEILPLEVMIPKLLAESDRVKSAKENFEATVHDLKSTMSAYMPNVSVNYGFNDENDKTPSQSSGSESVAYTHKSGIKKSITLTQMIWDGGRTDTAVDISKRNSQKTQITLEMLSLIHI